MTGSQPKLAEDLEITETYDGLVLFQESTERVHHLNETAGAILSLCDGTRDVAEIAQALAEGFGLAEPPLPETRACLAELSREGLVS